MLVIKDFRCTACEKQRRDELVDTQAPSPECCGQPMERFFAGSAKVHEFKEGWYEHIAEKPLYITSKRQLREECEKRGQYSEYSRD